MKSTITYETAPKKKVSLEEMRRTFPHYHIVEDSQRFFLHPTDPLTQGYEVLVVDNVLPVRYTGELIDPTTTQLGSLEDWEAVFGRKFNGDCVLVRWGDFFWQNQSTPCLRLNDPLLATHVWLSVFYQPPKAGNPDSSFLHRLYPMPGLEYMHRLCGVQLEAAKELAEKMPGLTRLYRQTCPNAPKCGVDTYIWWVPGDWYFDLTVVMDPQKLRQLKIEAHEQFERRLNEGPKRANGLRED